MKHKFKGIGKAGALLMFAGLAASPFAVITNGIAGKITFWLLEQLSMWMADKGLIILNIGAAKINTLSEQQDFDGSFEQAFKEIHENNDRLTDEQKKAIDDKVISAFRKFATFGELRDGRNP